MTPVEEEPLIGSQSQLVCEADGRLHVASAPARPMKRRMFLTCTCFILLSLLVTLYHFAARDEVNLSAVCRCLGLDAASRVCFDAILFHRDTQHVTFSQNIRQAAASSLQFHLTVVQQLPGVVTAQRLSAQHYPSGWVLTNPTIAPRTDGGSGYVINCRAVNYLTDPYRIIESERLSKHSWSTRNVLLVTDADFHVLVEGELVYPADTPLDGRASFHGIEDVRIIDIPGHAGEYFLTGTAQELHNDGRNAIAIGRVSVEPILRRVRSGTHPLRDARDQVHVPMSSIVSVQYGNQDVTQYEKNWMLGSTNKYSSDAVHALAVYSTDPLTVLELDPTNGEASVLSQVRLPFDLSRFRGGAGPIPFGARNESRLLVIHDVLHLDEGRRYVHRFVLMDAQLSAVHAVSPPLTFQDQRVEFVCGMTASLDGQSVIVTLGVHDREAWLFVLSNSLLQQLLQPVPTIENARGNSDTCE